jgi:cytochrome c oxidase cbb3-type subunit 3
MAKIENEKLMDHEYDGIQELDNFLPPWWTWLFIITIVFSVAYVFHFHIFKTGDLQAVEFYKDMNPEWSQDDLRMAGPSYRYESPYAGSSSVATVTVSTTSTSNGEPVDIVLLTDNTSLDNGKQIYTVNCVACHGVNGEGLIGPNMTDDYWIHGGSLEDIVHIINVGVPAKGMIPWDKTLTPLQILEVSSYIVSLVGTDPPNQKAPEGELYIRYN